MTQITGSGSESGSGSVSQRHGSADPDPDPHQNVMDPQHWILLFKRRIYIFKVLIWILLLQQVKGKILGIEAKSEKYSVAQISYSHGIVW
jgi:hypothetical protein